MKTIIPALLLLPLATHAQVLFDFNSSSQMDEFNRTEGAATSLGWAASGGIDDTGRVATANNIRTAYVQLDSFDPSSTPFTLSTNFRFGNFNSVATNIFQLGIAPDSGYVPTFNLTSNEAGKSQISVALNLTSANLLRLIIGSQDGGVNSFIPLPLGVAVTANSWYFLEMSFSLNTVSNIFSLSASVYNADGTTGAPVGGALQTVSGNLTNVALGQDSGVHTYFATATGANLNGFTGLDNLTSPIPEPSSAGLLLLGLGACIWRRKSHVQIARS